MKSENSNETIYDRLGKLIGEESCENLLQALKAEASNVEIYKRDDFEKALLKLAQETVTIEKRTVLYEAMVSLQTIWNQFQPKQNFQEKFNTAFELGNHEEAVQCYKDLVKQGIDYTGTGQKEEGKIVSIYREKCQLLLHYSKNKLSFLDQNLDKSSGIDVEDSIKILDIIAPLSSKITPPIDTYSKNAPAKVAWILLEKNNDSKKVVTMKLEKKAAHSRRLNFLFEHQAYLLSESNYHFNRLAFFKDHLLLISDQSIQFYRENEGWKEWYSTPDRITSFASTSTGFWVGHTNGDVFILKDLDYVGVRDAFKGFSNPIEEIHSTASFILVSSKNQLNIVDHAGNPTLPAIDTESEIIESAILDNEYVILHLANGMLLAKELKQGNTCWQLNLGEIYDQIIILNECVYCWRQNGKVMQFNIPEFGTMKMKLESKGIYVSDNTTEAAADAPVKYITDFIGRRSILDRIKENLKSHHLLYGEPKTGKTSILNVLRDELSEQAKCCYINMEQLVAGAKNYTEIEQRFLASCLSQHCLKLDDDSLKEGYPALRALVNTIRGKRKYYALCLDNFYIPFHLPLCDLNKFKSLIGSMWVHENVCLVISCSIKKKKEIFDYFDREFREYLAKRKLNEEQVPLFSEQEVKNAIRRFITLDQGLIDEIYGFTGRFPHLVHLFGKYNEGQQSIKGQAEKISQKYNEKIFGYFKELSVDAFLLLATCLNQKLLDEKISYSGFYEKIPFLRISLPIEPLKRALDEISNYSDGINVLKDDSSFVISLGGQAKIFQKSSQYISWIPHFRAFYDFSSSPGQEKAHKAAKAFTEITQSELKSDGYLEGFPNIFKDKYYVNRLTDQSRNQLGMLLTTYIVFTLKKWGHGVKGEDFNDLYTSIQEYNRKAKDRNLGVTTQKFYILLFDLHGTYADDVRKDIKGLERISILDADMLKNVILDENPKGKASEYIFSQLSIQERSPYTTSGAVPDELFFGRELEIALIRGIPENIGIFGTRTIGKTSLLQKFIRDIKSQSNWKVIFIDCSKIEDEVLLLKNIAEKLVISFEEISDLGKLRRYISGVAEKEKIQFLFLLDEVDRLVENDFLQKEKILKTFHRICTETLSNGEPATRFILCGFHKMFEQMMDPESRLYNFMVFLPLKPLDEKSALQLVTKPMKGIHVKWSNEEEDAKYLVENCSGHPLLLQTACQSLLSILDDKNEYKDRIEREDVDKALYSDQFQKICMRLYHTPPKPIEPLEKVEMVVERKRSFFNINREQPVDAKTAPPEREDFLSDIHRITILAAIRLRFEEAKEQFSLADIQKELNRYEIDISPNVMRNVLDRLCLSGNFRVRNESVIIAQKDSSVKAEIEKKLEDEKKKSYTIGNPEVYKGDDNSRPGFLYEFGVKIFPDLLVANFGGIDKCKEELQNLVEKGDMKEWLRRY